MPLSGSTLWELNRDQLIQAAMRKCGALAQGQVPTAEDYTNNTIALNGILAAFQTKGMQLWLRTEITVPLTASTENYSIGVGQTINTPFLLKLYAAYLRNTATGQRVDMEIKSAYEWNEIRTNTTSSYPVFVAYTPAINVGILNVWPIPDATAASTYTIRLIGQSPVDDVNSSADTLEFPKEWHNAIIYELANTIAPEYGVSDMVKNTLEKDAKKWLDMAVDFGADEASLFFQPVRR